MKINARKASVIVFRIVYSSSYTVLFIALLLLLAVTPGDHIYQTVSNHKLGNVFVVGGTYLVTGLIAVFIYASRLYTNRTTLAAIPKPYLPIEDGEVGKKVRKMIVKNRQRTALIALQSRPRPSTVAPIESTSESTDRQAREVPHRRLTKHKRMGKNCFINFDPLEPPWGEITHPGWSGPASGDLSEVQFSTVIAELPNLIEARAVSLAALIHSPKIIPADSGKGETPSDAPSVAQLQRAPSQGLRDYLDQLDDLSIFADREIVDSFLEQYEYARFSTDAMLESEFRSLMTDFSNLLVGMRVGSVSSVSPQQSKKRSSESSSSLKSTSSVVRPKFRTSPADDKDVASISSQGSSQSVVRHRPYDPG